MDSSVATWKKPFVKWFRLGKSLLIYYRDGIKHIIVAYKNSQPFELGSTYREIEAGERKITRVQFIESMRSRREIKKIPNFILLSIIFEELTVLICYYWPKIALWNCLNPGGFKKITESMAIKSILPNNSAESKYVSPYSLPKKLLSSTLQQSTVMRMGKWKLKLFDLLTIQNKAVERLVAICQYTFIDDCLLLQNILQKTEMESILLGYDELVNFIFERRLYYGGEDLNAMVNTVSGREVLIWRLFLYLSFRFDNTIYTYGSESFSEKWGLNNVTILNNPGSTFPDVNRKQRLIKETDLHIFH